MGYYLQVDLKDPEPLASLHGWGDVIRWVGTLPPDADHLHHLCLYGWGGDVPATRKQLAKYIAETPPASHDTRQTVDNLLALLRAAGDAEVVSVTDGIG